MVNMITVSCEYVLVCLANYFGAGEYPDINKEMNQMLNEIIDHIHQNSNYLLQQKLGDVGYCKHVLQCCTDERLYFETAKSLLSTGDGVWSQLMLTFMFFAKLISVKSILGMNCYAELLHTQALVKQYDINRYIRNQSGDWKTMKKVLKMQMNNHRHLPNSCL